MFNKLGERDQRCCTEHDRVSGIICHSIVRDLTAHVYVIVCLMCHAFEETRGVCSRPQRGSGVGGPRATFGNQFLRVVISTINKVVQGGKTTEALRWTQPSPAVVFA